jgi:hypothetical protein
MTERQFTLFDSLDLSNANEAVLVANTPFYLLDRLRKDSSVAHLAQSLSSAAILDELRDLSAIDPQRVQDIVQRYVYLAALAMKDPREVWPGLNQIDLRKLEWGEQLRAMIEAQTVATSRVVIGTPMEMKRTVPPVQATNTRSTQMVQQDPRQGTIII